MLFIGLAPDQLLHLQYMYLLNKWQFWASIPGVAGLWALVFKVMLPGLRKWLIRGMAEEGAYFVETIAGLMVDRRYSPTVRSAVDKLYRDRIRMQDQRWEEITSRLGHMEQESRLSLENIGSLSLQLENHNETLELLKDFMPQHRVLLETQINQTAQLNTTLESLRSDISAHTSQIGELRGVLKTLGKGDR